jgi:hypothetical protein
MNAQTSTRRSTSWLSLIVVTLAALAIVWASTHYADAMVTPASNTKASASSSLPRSCKALAQLPGGKAFVRELTSQRLSRTVLAASCTEGLERYADSVTPKTDRTLELPQCSDESGRYDGTCYVEQGKNTYLSLNRGEWFYVLATQDLIKTNK